MAEGPVAKKTKMIDNIDNLILKVKDSAVNLTAVLSDEFYSDMVLTPLYAGHVIERKSLSTTICILNEKLPLKDFQHLKRVNKDKVLICPVSLIKSYGTIEEFFKENLPELSNNIFDSIQVVEVPLHPPKTKAQSKEWNQKWSSNFHPDKYIEKLLTKTYFQTIELAQHRLYMTIALEVAKWYSIKNNSEITEEDFKSGHVNTSVIVDPLNKSIVAISVDNRETHPIQHASMLAIDNVAKTQNGGAWNKNSTDLYGIDKSAISHIKSKYPQIEFGCRKYVSKSEMSILVQLDCPYLCTGYYIYTIREPCIMCAMGLVHARINKVFFCYENKIQGALKSKEKLHCIQSLNHRFEVFTGFM